MRYIKNGEVRLGKEMGDNVKCRDVNVESDYKSIILEDGLPLHP